MKCYIQPVDPHLFSHFFFFNDTAPPEIYTLSLHDALPIFPRLTERSTASQFDQIAIDPPRNASYHVGDSLLIARVDRDIEGWGGVVVPLGVVRVTEDRKSTRLNCSHIQISYAVFCLKKKRDRGHERILHLVESAQAFPDEALVGEGQLGALQTLRPPGERLPHQHTERDHHRGSADRGGDIAGKEVDRGHVGRDGERGHRQRCSAA